MPDKLTLFLPPHGINFQHRARVRPATESFRNEERTATMPNVPSALVISIRNPFDKEVQTKKTKGDRVAKKFVGRLWGSDPTHPGPGTRVGNSGWAGSF